MKITVKPMKGEKFSIDVELSMTASEVKTIIKQAKGWEESCQKLICKAKILADDKPLSEYKITEKDFLVCMVTKPKIQEPKTQAPPVEEATPAPAATPATTTPTPAVTTTASTPAATAPTSSAPAQTSSTEQSQAAPAAGGLAGPGLQGPEFEAGVAQLQEMGFAKADCEGALAAAFGDRERAVEYLMNGIPPAAAAALASASTGGAPSSAGAATTAAQPSSSEGLESLRRHPRFNELKRIVQSDPSALSQVLPTLLQGNNELLRAIEENSEEFVRIMNEPIDDSDTAQSGRSAAGTTEAGALGGAGVRQPDQYAAILQAMQNMPAEQRAQLAQAMGVPPEQLQAITQTMQNMPPEAFAHMMGSLLGAGGGGAPGMPGNQQNVVQLTPDEAAAIDRLVELGFPKSACVEAYLACDKNEQLAANYLFTNPPDAMEEDNAGDS